MNNIEHKHVSVYIYIYIFVSHMLIRNNKHIHVYRYIYIYTHTRHICILTSDVRGTTLEALRKYDYGCCIKVWHYDSG